MLKLVRNRLTSWYCIMLLMIVVKCNYEFLLTLGIYDPFYNIHKTLLYAIQLLWDGIPDAICTAIIS